MSTASWIERVAHKIGVPPAELARAVIAVLCEPVVVEDPMAQPRPPDRIAYSVAEVAEMIGASPDLVRGLIDRGELVARRIGRRVVIPASEVTRLLGPEVRRAG